MHLHRHVAALVATLVLGFGNASTQPALAASPAASSPAAQASYSPHVLQPASAPQQAQTASTWEAKDTVLAAGVLVTLILGVWNALSNHHFNKRTTFVNTVTAQRIKWIEQLRQDISSFSGLTYHWCYRKPDDPEESRKIVQEIDRLRHVIRLRLNPAGEHDREIERLLEEIPNHTSSPNAVAKLLEDLTKATQSLLKEEWEKVKQESARGPLSQRA